MKPLFIPLKGEFYEAFADGSKTVEYRRYGPRWNERTCERGRPVVLTSLHDAGVIRWPIELEPPSQEHMRKAVLDTLERWGAIQDGRITTIGRRLIG